MRHRVCNTLSTIAEQSIKPWRVSEFIHRSESVVARQKILSIQHYVSISD